MAAARGLPLRQSENAFNTMKSHLLRQAYTFLSVARLASGGNVRVDFIQGFCDVAFSPSNLTEVEMALRDIACILTSPDDPKYG